MANIIRFPGTQEIAEGVIDIDNAFEVKNVFDGLEIEDMEEVILIWRDKEGEVVAKASGLSAMQATYLLEKVKTAILLADEGL